MLLFQETTTTTDDDLFQGVRDFFDSDYWLVGRNVALFFAVDVLARARVLGLQGRHAAGSRTPG